MGDGWEDLVFLLVELAHNTYKVTELLVGFLFPGMLYKENITENFRGTAT